MTTTCPTCNSELLTSNGQTFCPACLLQQGMKSSTYGGGPRVAWKPPEIEQLTAAFPHLEIQQLLGVGGMGAVFKVRQKELDRIAALKVLPGEMAADAGFTERFLREARLLASLSHPHIVTVYEFGQRDGIYFLLMEFIDGVTLRQALRAEPIKKLGSKETLAIVGQLCDALQFAHDEGVVHRDIKPENILIDKRGRVKIADFGLARLLGQSPTMPTLTRTHQLMGTPAYMAPEQIEGLPGIDHRADIYSMGVVFYELLTGELPLGRFSPPSERAETDVRLDEVVLRTLAREPDRRYQQASQVKTDVEALSAPNAMTNPFAFPARRRWIGRGVAGFIAGVLVTPVLAIVFYFAMEARQLSRSRAEAIARERKAANDYVQKEIAEAQARRAADGSMDQNPMAGIMGGSDAGSGMMSGAGGDGMPGMSGMPGGMGGAMYSNPIDSGSAVVVENSVPLLNTQLFNLTVEQREAVNTILKETHDRYLKEEALHSIVSVDANGVQTTEISAFPDQLRAIENEMWTKLDDAVPVETQKEFRSQLNLYTTEGQSDGGGSDGMGAMGMAGPMPGGEMGMSARMMTGPGTGPGLLGWEPRHYPLKLNISRSGRWFEWSIQSKHHSATGSKAPTLPFALQRFYREPGPWMAVANVRGIYAAHDWSKLSDHFTAAGQLRGVLQQVAFREVVLQGLDGTEQGMPTIAMMYNQKLLEEYARWEKNTGAEAIEGAAGLPESSMDKVLLQLRAATTLEIDSIIEKESGAVPNANLRWEFTVCGISCVAYQTDQELFELAELAAGEASSYTETGDTASATLTIPNKPPVPIRFQRENGQWKIDAIGSNERLLERLKQTKIWKQHAEIEAVLENARTAYAAKEWQTLADCFTRAGKYRWTLRTHSMMPTNASPLPEEELKLRMEKFRAEIERLSVQQVAAGRTIDQPLPEEGDGREWRILLDQFLSCPANESDSLLIKLTESLPETVVDSSFAGWVIQSAFLYPDVNCFDFDGCKINDLKLTEGIATANLVRKDSTPPMPVRFVKHDGLWKIDAIGTSEELQQQVRIALDCQNGDSPRAAVGAFREAMADGRFQTALNCMTEDARNEWLGEMLIGYVSNPNADNLGNGAVRFSIGEVRAIQTATDANLEFLSNRLKKDPRRSDRTVSPADRRKVAIEAGVSSGDIGARISMNMVIAFLNARFQTRPKMLDTQMLGEFQEIPLDRDGPEVMKHRLQPASPDQPPLELDIIQIDGLWKINTIVDPAMKPWPLPAEEPTPPAEATPVDGATGLR